MVIFAVAFLCYMVARHWGQRPAGGGVFLSGKRTRGAQTSFSLHKDTPTHLPWHAFGDGFLTDGFAAVDDDDLAGDIRAGLG